MNIQHDDNQHVVFNAVFWTVMLSVGILIVMLSVAFFLFFFCYAHCRIRHCYAECNVFIVMLSATFFTVFAECRYSECRSASHLLLLCWVSLNIMSFCCVSHLLLICWVSLYCMSDFYCNPVCRCAVCRIFIVKLGPMLQNFLRP